MANRPLDFLREVVAGTADLPSLPARALADEHYFWSVRYDEQYTAEEGQLIMAALQCLERELLARKAAEAPHG